MHWSQQNLYFPDQKRLVKMDPNGFESNLLKMNDKAKLTKISEIILRAVEQLS